MKDSLQKILDNLERQIAHEKARAKLRSPDGDRRCEPSGPPAGQVERRSGQERRRPRNQQQGRPK